MLAASQSERTPQHKQSLPFVGTWVLAIALSLGVASVVEYRFASRQMERRLLESQIDDYAHEVEALREIVTSPVGAVSRRDAIRAIVSHAGREHHDVMFVGVFDRDGQLVASSGGEKDEAEASEIRRVIEAGGVAFGREVDEGEAADDSRFEFMVPVRGAGGDLVLEIDQRAEVIDHLLHDLRARRAWGSATVIVIAVPLSYLLGGRVLRRRNAAAERAADTDALTGLSGRRQFRPVLEATMSDRRVPSTALVLVDLDDFKFVNDRLGHSFGDRVLRVLAQSFGVGRAADRAFRLGGDEFAMMLPDASEADAVEVVERVRAAFNAAMPSATFSAGVASAAAADKLSADELWERCDAALYEAKHLGRRRTIGFSSVAATVSVAAEKLEFVAALLRDEEELTVAFQPIWDLHDGRLIGHEALLRLGSSSPISGPSELFELAVRLGLVGKLDERARTATLRAVRGCGWSGLLFINLHPESVRELDVEGLLEQIHASGLTPASVVVEVTEHTALANGESVRQLKLLQACGFRVALDDLGHANAGLQALAAFQYDVLKIDRAVIARIGTDPASHAALAAAAAFAERTGAWVIAEGIEDDDVLHVTQTSVVRSQQFPTVLAGQGYLLGGPAPTPWPADARLMEPTPAGIAHSSP